jgi:glycosyltransferase involved in cell wall biosynthesis
MKILHVITTLEKGGAEKQLVILSRNQATQDHEISVLPLKGNLELDKEFSSFKAQIFDDIRNRNFIIQIILFRKLLKKKRFDVIHLHLPRAEIVGVLASLGLRIVAISSRHNTEPFFPGSPRLVSTLLSRVVLFRQSSVIAISKSVKTFLLSRREISKRQQVDVIYYGYDETISAPKQPRELRDGEKLEKFVTLSRLAPQKDLKTMIEAIAIYRGKFGFGQLEVYGDGPLDEELNTFARNLGIAQYVVFCGRTSDVPKVMQKNQCFLLSSKYEGFGLVLLEAMQQGLPIICSKISTTEEVMGLGYGLFFETSNPQDLAIKMEFLQQPKLYRDSSEYGIQRLSEFDPRKSAMKILNVYDEFLEGGRGENRAARDGG